MKAETRYLSDASIAILLSTVLHTWPLSKGTCADYQTYQFLLPDHLTPGTFGGLRIYC
jgi:hypothetical protein